MQFYLEYHHLHTQGSNGRPRGDQRSSHVRPRYLRNVNDRRAGTDGTGKTGQHPAHHDPGKAIGARDRDPPQYARNSRQLDGVQPTKELHQHPGEQRPNGYHDDNDGRDP